MSDAHWQLAQVNIGRARGAITDDVMLGFVSRSSVEEAVSRLAHLKVNGPTPHAFSFAQAFDPEGRAVARERSTRDDACPAK